jgi:hypothetical protein
VDAELRRHAGVDAVPRTVFVTGPEIPDVTFFERQYAGLADTHTATERHLDADLLTRLQQRCRPVDLDGHRQRSPVLEPTSLDTVLTPATCLAEVTEPL